MVDLRKVCERRPGVFLKKTGMQILAALKITE
jgi:hypothetical protein